MLFKKHNRDKGHSWQILFNQRFLISRNDQKTSIKRVKRAYLYCSSLQVTGYKSVHWFLKQECGVWSVFSQLEPTGGSVILSCVQVNSKHLTCWVFPSSTLGWVSVCDHSFSLLLLIIWNLEWCYCLVPYQMSHIPFFSWPILLTQHEGKKAYFSVNMT